MEKLIEVFNLGGLPTAPLDSFLELQEDFKKSDPDKLSKLQMLIITRGFKYAFKAWKDPDGKLWIIDAHQRRKALIALRKAGFTIPDIPYEPIFAADKKKLSKRLPPTTPNSPLRTRTPSYSKVQYRLRYPPTLQPRIRSQSHRFWPALPIVSPRA